MGQTREQRIIKQVVGKPMMQQFTPVADGMFLPNHSGIKSHPEFKDAISSFLTAESDTLATVTGRGATTSTKSFFTGAIDTSKADFADPAIKALHIYDDKYSASDSSIGTIGSGIYKTSTGSGSFAFVNFVSPADTNSIYRGMVNGDTQTRIRIMTGGKFNWGDGSNIVDTYLYRASAGVLKTDDTFEIVKKLVLSGVNTDSGIEITGATRPQIKTQWGSSAISRTGNLAVDGQYYNSINAYYDGSWKLDNTSYAAVIVDVGTFSYSPFRIRHLTAGSNPRTAVNDLILDTSYIFNFYQPIKMQDKDIQLGTSTGTKIGTATSQKLGFWNATPIIQPTTAITAATFAANTSNIANDTATFDGYTIGQVVKALRNAGILA